MTVGVIIENLSHDPCRLVGVFSGPELAVEHATEDYAYDRSVHKVELDAVVAHEPN